MYVWLKRLRDQQDGKGFRGRTTGPLPRSLRPSRNGGYGRPSNTICRTTSYESASERVLRRSHAHTVVVVEGLLMILSDDDMQLATDAGTRRYERRRGATHKWNRNPADHTVDVDIRACAAEIAVARALRKEWVELDRPDPEGDVGPGIQVRYSSRDWGALLLHPDDDDTHRFYLVTGTPPALTVRGWILAGDGKMPEFWRELQPGRPCFVVPQEILHHRL